MSVTYKTNETSPSLFQGQCDLLRSAKMDALDALRQLVLACEASGLTLTSELQYTPHSLTSRRGSNHGNGRI